MGLNRTSRNGFKSNSDANRSLQLEQLEPRLMMAANFLGLRHASLANLTKSLRSDGSINRTDMITILQTVQYEADGVIETADLRDMRVIVKNASALKMPNYVKVLASDVVNGSVANDYYLSDHLGNLVVGSTAAQLGKLINKWFYGMDVPYATDYEGRFYYTMAEGTLFGANGPSRAQEQQGIAGTCYLITGAGSIADRSKAAIRNMFIDNGDDTWTVRFYSNGKADYVTVNRCFSVSESGIFIFNGRGNSAFDSNNVLWLSLLEKAYAQWNETGKTKQGTYINSYSGIEGGWTGDVYEQILGFSATPYCRRTSTANAKQTIINALNAGQAVAVGTKAIVDAAHTGLYGNHAYSVISYDKGADVFTLYNPWGYDQPCKLTWKQLRNNTDAYAVTATSGRPGPSRVILGMAVCGSVITAPRSVVISTATTLDDCQVQFTPPPAATEVYFVSQNTGTVNFTMPEEPSREVVRRKTTDFCLADEKARPDDLFWRIDEIIDSICWELKTCV